MAESESSVSDIDSVILLSALQLDGFELQEPDICSADPVAAAQHDTIELQESTYNLENCPRDSTVGVTEVNVSTQKQCCNAKISFTVVCFVCAVMVAGGVGVSLYFFDGGNSKSKVKSSFASV